MILMALHLLPAQEMVTSLRVALTPQASFVVLLLLDAGVFLVSLDQWDLNDAFWEALLKSIDLLQFQA